MVAIEVKDVWKKYKLYHDKGSTLKEKVLFKHRNKYEERWVLKGIDLQLEKGDTVGLIGENGSGKSTLLKLLTRISYPNKGEITIKGKVSSLLELGAGFHPDMTGRENIYTNASIFGLTREDIDSKLESIISFSELEGYIDSPVRTYSSGMYMRLAFSVAINVDAEILLIDEILAVGDLNFQKKCFNRMQRLKQEGVTIVLVSHDLSSVEKLCNKAVWINEGKAEAFGDSLTVCKQYLQFMLDKNEKSLQDSVEQLQMLPNEENGPESEDTEALPEGSLTESDSDVKKRWGNEWATIKEVHLLDKDDNKRFHFQTGAKMSVSIKYKINKRPDTLGFGVAIHRADGIYCYGTNTFIDKVDIKAESIPDEGTFIMNIDTLLLLEGRYYLDVAIHNNEGLAFDYRIKMLEFEVLSDIKDEGLCRMPHSWGWS